MDFRIMLLLFFVVQMVEMLAFEIQPAISCNGSNTFPLGCSDQQTFVYDGCESKFYPVIYSVSQEFGLIFIAYSSWWEGSNEPDLKVDVFEYDDSFVLDDSSSRNKVCSWEIDKQGIYPGYSVLTLQYRDGMYFIFPENEPTVGMSSVLVYTHGSGGPCDNVEFLLNLPSPPPEMESCNVHGRQQVSYPEYFWYPSSDFNTWLLLVQLFTTDTGGDDYGACISVRWYDVQSQVFVGQLFESSVNGSVYDKDGIASTDNDPEYTYTINTRFDSSRNRIWLKSSVEEYDIDSTYYYRFVSYLVFVDASDPNNMYCEYPVGYDDKVISTDMYVFETPEVLMVVESNTTSSQPYPTYLFYFYDSVDGRYLCYFKGIPRPAWLSLNFPGYYLSSYSIFSEDRIEILLFASDGFIDRFILSDDRTKCEAKQPIDLFFTKNHFKVRDEQYSLNVIHRSIHFLTSENDSGEDLLGFDVLLNLFTDQMNPTFSFNILNRYLYHDDGLYLKPQYSHNDCGLFTECFGVTRMTEQQVLCGNGNGICISPDNCTCKIGYYGPDCEVWNCFGIPYYDVDVCSKAGSCDEHDYCQCEAGFYGVECDQYEMCHGIECDNGGTCENGLCVCKSGYCSLQDLSIDSYESKD